MVGATTTAPATTTTTTTVPSIPSTTPTTSAFPPQASPYAFSASEDTFLTPLISPAFEPSPHLNPDLLLSPLVSPALAASPQDLANLNAMTERWNSALASLASSPVFQPSASSASSITIPHTPAMGAFTLSHSNSATSLTDSGAPSHSTDSSMMTDEPTADHHSHGHAHSHSLSGAPEDPTVLLGGVTHRKYASRRISAPLGSMAEKQQTGKSPITLHQLSSSTTPSLSNTTHTSPITSTMTTSGPLTQAISPATVMGMRRDAAGFMGSRTSSPITPAALMQQLQGDGKVKLSSPPSSTDPFPPHMAHSASVDSGAPPDAGMRREGEGKSGRASKARSTKSSSSSSSSSSPKVAPKPSRLTNRSISAHVPPSSSSSSSSPSLKHPGMASPMPSPSLAASPAGGPIRTGSVLSGPSPSLKPRLPSGVDEDVARSLAIRSNYSHIRSGKASTLGLDFDPTLSAEMEARRSSHKAAEQKRRDALKQCFQNLRQVVPEAGDEAASKTFLLRKSYEYICKLKDEGKRREAEVRRLRKRVREMAARLGEVADDDVELLDTAEADGEASG
ncbi:MAG: hypothetical protein DHS80DRAFT_23489 [Piptocephalis tieghemiana]|nr:MAG: hypothetical protein DHS80DRAFT_23489 [Piptocephalis tieghemiana]